MTTWILIEGKDERGKRAKRVAMLSHVEEVVEVDSKSVSVVFASGRAIRVDGTLPGFLGTLKSLAGAQAQPQANAPKVTRKPKR